MSECKISLKGGPKILGLCNPLLDVTAYVDNEFLEKHDLEANNAILADDKHVGLIEEIESKYSVDYTAGGSAQNSMRVVAGILKKQNFKADIIFSGCVGHDKHAELMLKKALEDGVKTSYAYAEDGTSTGTCAVMLTNQGKDRSLCAFLGASQKFNEQHLLKHWQEIVEGTKVVYMTGFLIAVSPKSFELLGEHVAKQKPGDSLFCFNLSAPYVSLVFGKELEKVMQYVDIVFGNDDEAKAYAQFKKWDMTEPKEIAKKIIEEPKLRENVPRQVVITQGEKPIIVAYKDSNGTIAIKEFECKQLKDSEVVDTNGAGDAFCGGYLSQYVQGASLESCIKMGSYAACEIIKLSGITIPNFDDIHL